MSQETCEICGERIAQKEKYICTITGTEWYMCKDCEEFFLLMDREMKLNCSNVRDVLFNESDEFDEFDLETD